MIREDFNISQLYFNEKHQDLIMRALPCVVTLNSKEEGLQTIALPLGTRIVLDEEKYEVNAPNGTTRGFYVNRVWKIVIPAYYYPSIESSKGCITRGCKVLTIVRR